jgi:dipeptidyl-peptidase 4
MTCLGLCKAPNTFRLGVAGAPVTSWDGYDTHYTERWVAFYHQGTAAPEHHVSPPSRYMSTPERNPEGYKRSSVLAHADKLLGRLLIVHGQIDENVHFRHTARLINALIAARRPYELLLFPDGRHSLRKAEDRIYLEQRLTDFFVQHLIPREAGRLDSVGTSGAGFNAHL